jgi:DNA-directed RNA polymerase subunit RPC12/RpoP
MDFVPVIAFNDYIEANLILGRLQNEGINCWLKDENAATIAPFLSNAIGGIKLMVAASQEERVFRLLKEFRQQQQSLRSCPRCGSNNTEHVSTPRKASTWLGALFGLLFTSHAVVSESVYHCFDCGKEFELPKEPETAR